MLSASPAGVVVVRVCVLCVFWSPDVRTFIHSLSNEPSGRQRLVIHNFSSFSNFRIHSLCLCPWTTRLVTIVSFVAITPTHSGIAWAWCIGAVVLVVLALPRHSPWQSFHVPASMETHDFHDPWHGTCCTRRLRTHFARTQFMISLF